MMIFGNITISFSSSTAPANYRILGSFRFDCGYENECDYKILLFEIIYCKHDKYVLKTEANDFWENLRDQNLIVVLIFVALVESIKLLALFPVDLKTRKSTGTSCQIEIHFSIEIIKFLMKYNLLCF